MKKFLTVLMMVALLMCYMPSMAFAGELDGADTTNVEPTTSTYTVKVILSTQEVVTLNNVAAGTTLEGIANEVKDYVTNIDTISIWGYVADTAQGDASALNPTQFDTTKISSQLDTTADTTITENGQAYRVLRLQSGYTLDAARVLVANVTKKSTPSYGGGSSSSGSSSGSAATTTTTTTTVTNTGSTSTGAAATTAGVSATTKTNTDGTKTTTATVDTATAAKVVENAISNKSEAIVIEAGNATAVKETAAGTTTEVAVPASAIAEVAEKTTAEVTIMTEAAEVTLDEAAVEAVAEQAGETGTITLVVDTVAQDANTVKVELAIETSNGKVSNFNGGKVSVTVKLSSALAAKNVVCVYIDDNGAYQKVNGQKNADGTFTFTATHFSTYAIMAEEEANTVLAAQDEKVTELTKALGFKARSSKTAKGSIKVNLTVSDEDIQAITDLGYTVKYKFYRSTKKASAYKAKVEKDAKTYTNTAGKKGTKYYYKARVMVYDSEGTLVAKTALKQCKYASRKF